MKHTQQSALLGFTLIEIMVSLTIASLISLIVINSYTSQASIFTFQGWRSKCVEEGREVFLLLHRLLRHAERDSIIIKETPNLTIIDFSIPKGHAIWPNHLAPYHNHYIRIQWHAINDNYHLLQLGLAESNDNLPNAKMMTLIGYPGINNTDIKQFSLTPTAIGYSLALTSSIGSKNSYTSEIGFEGHIIPRN